MMAVTALMIVSIVGLLCYRWIAIREPSLIQVQGNERWAGALVRIEGASLPKPHEAKLDKENEFTTRFFLKPGIYKVRVRKGGVDRFTHEFGVADSLPRILNLGTLKLDAPPATRP